MPSYVVPVTAGAESDRSLHARVLGLAPVLTPPLPMPAHLTLEFLPALDWTAYGPGAADDTRIVSACYEEVTGRLQAALDHLAAEQPFPLLLGCSRLTARAAAGVVQRVRNLGPAGS